jgi:hypothetical protein
LARAHQAAALWQHDDVFIPAALLPLIAEDVFKLELHDHAASHFQLPGGNPQPVQMRLCLKVRMPPCFDLLTAIASPGLEIGNVIYQPRRTWSESWATLL